MLMTTYIIIGTIFVIVAWINGAKISEAFKESKSLEETFACVVGLTTCILLWPVVIYRAIKNSDTYD